LTIRPSKAILQRLEIKIPMRGKLKFSVGTAYEVDDCVKWDIPVSKLKSKAVDIEIANALEPGKPIKKIEAEVTSSKIILIAFKTLIIGII